MVATRRSARVAAQQDSSPPASAAASPPKAAPAKRKSEAVASPAAQDAKRGKTEAEPKQTTIEESMDLEPTESAKETETKPTANDESTKAPTESAEVPVETSAPEPETEKLDMDLDKPSEVPAESKPVPAAEVPAESHDTSEMDVDKPEPKMTTANDDAIKADTTETTKKDEDWQMVEKPAEHAKEETNGEPKADEHVATTQEQPKQPQATTNGDAHKVEEASKLTEPPEDASSGQPKSGETAVEPHGRDEEPPSSILEKGLIYFMFRGRVGIDDPSQVDDIARSYLLMRPLPKDAKIGQGPIGDDGNCRLLALPKKVLPTSGKDKFMTFVEKTKTTFKELKDSVFSATDYQTQTAGARHSPAMTPVAEGVYALTTTGRESHLAYILTIPSELSEVQKDVGLRDRGSFVVSAKNPQYPGPANASLPQTPDFPKEIIDEFRSLRWMPLQPRLLDYENTQFLLIGESSGIEPALQPQDQDQEKTTETPKEEMEKLEGEDEIRVKHLKGDDAIFADLGLNHKEYSSVPSTW